MLDVIKRVPGLFGRSADVKGAMEDKLAAHREHICRYGDDLPEVRDWHWAGDRRME